MTVLLMYEHLVREWDAMNHLKRELESEGIDAYIFSIIYERNKALACARKIKIDAIIVPWFVDESHEKILYPFIEINNSVKIINMHHEEIGSDASDSVFFPKTIYTTNGSYHISWGQFFYDKLVLNGVNKNRIYITGNIRNDNARQFYTNREELAQKYNLDVNKKWILFAENRGYYIQRISDDLRKELNRRGMNDELIDLRTKYEVESLQIFIKQMKSWNENKRRSFEMIYRPHPGTHAPNNLPNWMHVIDDLSIYEWLNACDLLLTSGSTTVFEAEICHKPCAIFESLVIPTELRAYGLDEYPLIKDINEIDNAIIDDLSSEMSSRKKPIYEKYFGIVDGNATKRTANAIKKIINDSLDIENIEAFKHVARATRREFIRHMIFEIVTQFMTKTRLIYYLHYPTSAYADIKDIPYAKEAEWTKKGVKHV